MSIHRSTHRRHELNVQLRQVDAAVALLDDKATVPFIARYRKEATGGLDDTQLRALEERLTYLRDLEDRRAAILKSIEEQGKLTPELAAQIRDADTKARLEDLYLPLQAEAAHQGADRARGRPRTAGARAVAGPDAESRSRGGGVRRRRQGRRRRGRRARRRALDSDGDLRRGRRARRRPAPAAVGARRVEVDGRARQGSRGRQVLRLLRGHRAGEERCRRIAPWRCCADARRASCASSVGLPDGGSTGPTEPERRIAGARRTSRTGTAPADTWLAETVRWTWKVKLLRPSRARHRSSGCASRPKPRRSACSAATCTTCCSPRRPDSA